MQVGIPVAYNVCEVKLDQINIDIDCIIRSNPTQRYTPCYQTLITTLTR